MTCSTSWATATLACIYVKISLLKQWPTRYYCYYSMHTGVLTHGSNILKAEYKKHCCSSLFIVLVSSTGNYHHCNSEHIYTAHISFQIMRYQQRLLFSFAALFARHRNQEPCGFSVARGNQTWSTHSAFLFGLLGSFGNGWHWSGTAVLVPWIVPSDTIFKLRFSKNFSVMNWILVLVKVIHKVSEPLREI